MAESPGKLQFEDAISSPQTLRKGKESQFFEGALMLALVSVRGTD